VDRKNEEAVKKLLLSVKVKLTMDGIEEAMHDMIDPKKIKELQKEVKVIEKNIEKISKTIRKT
jgi:malate/lactate dehydrogenase